MSLTSPGRLSPMKISLISFLVLGILLNLVSCDLAQIPIWQVARPTQSAMTPSTLLPPTVTPSQATPAITPTFPAGTTPPPTLKIWLPPQFNPDGDSQASALLKARLQAFAALHPGLKIEVRIKASIGNGGLLDTLAATSAAAPAALPDLVALSRSDLEAATLKGLLFPFNSKSIVSENPDWFNYARQMALIQGSTFGMPFAGDALVLVFRPSQNPKPPGDWNGLILLHQNGVLAFPAADPQSLLTLALYESTGAPVEDTQQRPTLNADALTSVLKIYASGAKEGAFPYWLTQYSTDAQSWQAFQDKRSNWVVTWTSRYLSELPPDGAVLPLFPVAKSSLTLATGWEWALVSPQAGQRELSTQLAEFLVDSNFLACWTAAAGYLPTRPSALAGWPNHSLQTMLNPVVISAQLRPSNETLIGLGPILEDAAIQVLKGQIDPAQAAQTAVDHLKGP